MASKAAGSTLVGLGGRVNPCAWGGGGSGWCRKVYGAEEWLRGDRVGVGSSHHSAGWLEYLSRQSLPTGDGVLRLNLHLWRQENNLATAKATLPPAQPRSHTPASLAKRVMPMQAEQDSAHHTGWRADSRSRAEPRRVPGQPAPVRERVHGCGGRRLGAGARDGPRPSQRACIHRPRNIGCRRSHKLPDILKRMPCSAITTTATAAADIKMKPWMTGGV